MLRPYSNKIRTQWQFRYGIAIFVSVLSVAIKLGVDGSVASRFPLLFPAVTVAAFFGGYGPGLLAAGIISLGHLYFFILPTESFSIASLDALLDFLLFSVGAFTIGGLTSSLYRSKEAALKLAEEKMNFISNVSHEIRTPLNAIVGFTSLLQKRELELEDQKYVGLIKQSSDILLKRIDEILDFSKLNNAKIELEMRPFCYHEKILESMSLFQQPAQAKGLSLSAITEENVPEILVGDSNRISQLLLNFVANAVKFTDAGSIVIRTSKVSSTGKVVVIKIEVTDTGIGISKAAQNNIFKTFSQADNTIAKKYGGTGLGLSISKKLVELMGGQIGVRSEKGRGATFWATLPLTVDSTSKNSRKISPLVEPHFRNARILVVEDNPVNQLVITKILEQVGCEVDSVASGREALELFTKFKYDLVFMDCQMPEMDGFETSREMRKIEASKKTRTPIIALSAYSLEEIKEKCLASGIDQSFLKPIDNHQLQKTLEFWLSKEKFVTPSVDTRFLSKIGAQLSGGVPHPFLKELVEAYARNTPKRLEALRIAIDAEDFKDIANVAHNLKSASGTVGALKMVEVCEKLETSVSNGSFHEVSFLSESLGKEFSSTMTALRSFVN